MFQNESNFDHTFDFYFVTNKQVLINHDRSRDHDFMNQVFLDKLYNLFFEFY